MRNYRILLGMGGVPPDDSPQAYIWEHRLHWVMVGVALLALPAFYFELAGEKGMLQEVGNVLDFFILAAFAGEFLWMLWLAQQKRLYVLHNWLNLLIIFGAAASLMGVEGAWLPLARLLRVAYVSLVLARVLGSLRNLLSPVAIPYVMGWAAITLAVAGAGFYWLEPTVHSYGEGLWLAFTSGATVGYGDIVPTTAASRIFAVFMVLLGYALLSLVTASIAAFFVGEDEKDLRRDMHRDIKSLRQEIAQLRAELRHRDADAAAQHAPKDQA
jgi:voltage-gated potassium channel